MNKHRKFTNSLKNIADMSFRCVDTVRQAVEDLEKAGFITKTQNFHFSNVHGKNIYAQTTYRVIRPVRENYTLVPYSWLKLELTPCTLQVLLSCRMFMIKEGRRSYPSIRKLSARIGVAKSTVCHAFKRIAELGILIVEHCKKGNGAYTSNSYHMVAQVNGKDVQLLAEGYVPSKTESLCSPISLWHYSSTVDTNSQDTGVVSFFLHLKQTKIT